MSLTLLQHAKRIIEERFGTLPPISNEKTFFSFEFGYPHRQYEGMPALGYSAGIIWEKERETLALSLCLMAPELPYWKGIEEYFVALSESLAPLLQGYVPREGLRANLAPSWHGSGQERTLMPAYAGELECKGLSDEDLARFLLAHIGCGSHGLFLCEEVFERLALGERPDAAERVRMLTIKRARLAFLQEEEESEDAPLSGPEGESDEAEREPPHQERPRLN